MATIKQYIQKGRLYFCYEPIVLTFNRKVVAYEQLVRLKDGDGTASFISGLSKQCRRDLDLFSLERGVEYILETGIPTTINVFAENLEKILSKVGEISQELERNNVKLGIEIHEDASEEVTKRIMEKESKVWWLLDDFTSRTKFAETLMSAYYRKIPVTVKLPFFNTKKAIDGQFFLDVIPSNWVLIAEGASPDDLERLFNMGVLLAQGRDLIGMESSL